jgi:uncharacterized protein (TIGR00299 family) protein
MPPHAPIADHVTHIHLDPLGGASGDMFISAILDAWPELESGLADALRAAGIPEALQIRRVADQRGGITGSRFVIDSVQTPPGPRTVRAVRSHLANSALSPDIREQAISIITLLGKVEAETHAVPLEDVEFHELGGWDTVVDCVAAVWLVHALGRPSWSLSPLPLGGGTVETAHGRLPIPAPATSRLLEGLVIQDDGIPGERVTPTGAAILHYLNPSQTLTLPALTLAGTGYGLGSQELEGTPNLLRALFFNRSEPRMAEESIGIIRCEVDDQTAEDLAHALERLRSVPGVRDVCYWTAVGKRGRMMAAIQILCDPDALHHVALACLNETSTIGVRTAIETRRVLPRVMHITHVDGRPVAIKRVTRPGGGQTAKIEFASLAESGGDFAERARIKRLAENNSLEESS